MNPRCRLPRALRVIALIALALPGVTAMSSAQTSVTFVPVADNIHSATLKDVGDGSYEITTTGPDPFVFLKVTGGSFGPGLHVLAFEYASPHGTDNLQVYAFPPLGESTSVTGPGLALSEGWSSHSIDIAAALKNVKGKVEGLRLDPGSHPGKLIRIRNIQLRAPNAREKQLAARAAARSRELTERDRRTVAYLSRRFAASVARVAVEADTVTIQGDTRGLADLWLADIPIWDDVTKLERSPTLTAINAPGAFTLKLNRHDGSRDRLLSRWALVTRNADGLELRSAPRYADEVVAVRKVPEQRPRTKKGLGGFWNHGPVVSDLDDLGISAVTINILLNNIVSTTPGEGWSPFRYAGRTFYANDGAIRGYDTMLAETAKRGIVVSAIILVAQGYNAPEGSWSRLVAHPDAHPSGIFVMPDMDSRDGVTAYAAAMDYLASRYCKADGPRIHHWIMHNEINAGWIWTNAGEKTDTLYMGLYHRSMRLAHLIARQYDPNSQAFISLEHHWNYTPEPRFYRGKRLLELLRDFCRVEGDFEWALAHHPYPDSLLVPRTWEDGHTDFTLDTPKITFRNIEVLDAWWRLKDFWFQGRTPRRIHLTEQGLNSPDYGEKFLREQAAGMAYAWSKFARLDSIEAFQYHAWIDNRAEFGLRIGLRRFPDDPDDPWGKKPIWYVYQAMGTPREASVFEPYKAVVGVKDWSDVRHGGAIR
jgi:hypothetical protein